MSTKKDVNLINQVVREMQLTGAKLDEISEIGDIPRLLDPFIQERTRIQYAIKERKIVTLGRLLQMFRKIYAEENVYTLNPSMLAPIRVCIDPRKPANELIIREPHTDGKSLVIADFVDVVPHNFWRTTCRAIIYAISIILEEENKLYRSQFVDIDEVTTEASNLLRS